MKKDQSVIPKGDYCYNEDGNCPYWSTDPEQDPMENGYCSFIEKGDWEMNKESRWRRTYVKNIGEIDDGEPKGKLKSAEEMGMYLSLLWDQVKECGIDMEH